MQGAVTEGRQSVESRGHCALCALRSYLANCTGAVAPSCCVRFFPGSGFKGDVELALLTVSGICPDVLHDCQQGIKGSELASPGSPKRR